MVRKILQVKNYVWEVCSNTFIINHQATEIGFFSRKDKLFLSEILTFATLLYIIMNVLCTSTISFYAVHVCPSWIGGFGIGFDIIFQHYSKQFTTFIIRKLLVIEFNKS